MSSTSFGSYFCKSFFNTLKHFFFHKRRKVPLNSKFVKKKVTQRIYIVPSGISEPLLKNSGSTTGNVAPLLELEWRLDNHILPSKYFSSPVTSLYEYHKMKKKWKMKNFEKIVTTGNFEQSWRVKYIILHGSRSSYL